MLAAERGSGPWWVVVVELAEAEQVWVMVQGDGLWAKNKRCKDGLGRRWSSTGGMSRWWSCVGRSKGTCGVAY